VISPTAAAPDGDQFASLKRDEGLPGWVFKRGQPLVVPDLAADSRWKSSPLPNGTHAYRSALAVPLAVSGDRVGTVLFLSQRSGAFATSQLRLVGAAAAQVTAIYQNTELRRLLEEAPAMPPSTPPPSHSAAPATVSASIAPPARAPARWMGVTVLLAGLAVIGAFVLVLALAPQVPGLAAAFGGGAAASATPPPPTPTQAASLPTAPAAQAVVSASSAALEPSTAASATPAPPSATATERPSATPTAAPTDTPTRTPTPTATLPGGALALAVVDLPDGLAARLRDRPGGTVIAGVLDGAQVEVLEGREEVDDIVWVRIRDANGQEGWIAESLLEITTP
jgi:hypothetical protein